MLVNRKVGRIPSARSAAVAILACLTAAASLHLSVARAADNRSWRQDMNLCLSTEDLNYEQRQFQFAVDLLGHVKINDTQQQSQILGAMDRSLAKLAKQIDDYWKLAASPGVFAKQKEITLSIMRLVYADDKDNLQIAHKDPSMEISLIFAVSRGPSPLAIMRESLLKG